MDELEQKRLQLANPYKTITELKAKSELTATEKKLLRDLENFEKQLKNATELKVPRQLCEQILLKNRLEHKNILRKKMKPLFTMAASMLLVGLVLIRFYILTPSTALANEALDHLYHEMDHMEQILPDVNKRFKDSLKMMGINKKITIKHLRFAGNCMLGKNPAIHLVLEMDNKIYTVLFLPDVHSKSIHSFNDDHFQGEIIPAKMGTVIVMGKVKFPMEALISSMQKSFS